MAAGVRAAPSWTGAVAPVLDAAAWVAGLGLAAAARYDVASSEPNRAGLAVAMAVVAVLHLGLARLTRHRGRYRYGSFDEITALAVLVFVVATALLVVVLLGPDRRLVPASAPYVGGALALLLMGVVRWFGRRAVDGARRPDAAGATRVLVLGAGDGGHQVVRSMLQDPDAGYAPVGLLDDDPRKRHLRLSGVRVLGTLRDLPAVVAATRAQVVLLAIPSADAALARDLTARCSGLGVVLKALPSTRELLGPDVGLRDIRDLTVEDLLGRHRIETDVDAIAGCLTGRRVLVTGAGGSIGSELCRQIAAYGPAELIMLDRDESALHAVQLSIDGRARLDDPSLVLVDIRDAAALDDVLRTRRPHVVFHAAALKHLSMLQAHPGEAVKTNVWGTLTLLEACAAHGVERFVHISTDKAADPTSALGWSKRIAERLVAHFAGERGTAYMSVRFGNVLGSRGSVLHTFAEQIRRGGPLTVTDRDVARYFMTTGEAVELVVQAAAIGRPGEALVLDMGHPVRIAELAERLQQLAGSRCEVVETGLRPGEKLREVRLSRGEQDRRPSHPLITQVPVPPVAPVAARRVDPWGPSAEVSAALRELASAPAPAPSALPASTSVPAPAGSRGRR